MRVKYVVVVVVVGMVLLWLAGATVVRGDDVEPRVWLPVVMGGGEGPPAVMPPVRPTPTPARPTPTPMPAGEG